jgi:hypothetical protein
MHVENAVIPSSEKLKSDMPSKSPLVILVHLLRFTSALSQQRTTPYHSLA